MFTYQSYPYFMQFTKTLLVWLVSLMMLSAAIAQDVSESNYPYMKTETAPGFSVTVLGQPKNVAAVIEQMIEAEAKSKAKSKKGMMVFEEAKFSPISSDKVTYYFTTEEPTRKDHEHTQVCLFMRDKIGQFVTSVTGPRTAEQATAWLEDLEVNVKIYEMGLVIEDQIKLLEKERKTHSGLVKDSVGLEEDIVDLQKDLKDKTQEILDQTDRIDEGVKQLDTFQAQMEALKKERKSLQEARRIQGRRRD